MEKNIILKKGAYDSQGNIIKVEEYRTKNYKQFDNIIKQKGEGFFLRELFTNDDKKCFDFIHFLQIIMFVKMMFYL